ncbi:MAG: PD40 domain-containing protein [Balneola sp.]|nr:PD40 domain-containing protein [Balneola sp.]MBO6652216.1 PD40 domain-containing protein [Balneola sp.]MBO6712731.1 PD40 domain-containing protein [Balneola sp.]MBO6801393.1 PD40 domain-containing protein [Balneola sp.]MBO6871904.1 PD40 domain-containing protein [Balneola sp.]
MFNNEQPEIPGKLVFSTPDGNGNYQIYTSLTNGENRKQLTHFKNDGAYSPAWSPDGKQIVFGRTNTTTSPGYYITIMNADGSGKQQLEGVLDGRAVNVVGDHPKWSPDGTKIAFDRCLDCELGGGNSELFVYDLDTNTITQLTDNFSKDSFPKWKNNFELFFTSDRDFFKSDSVEFFRDLYTIRTTDLFVRRITESGNFGSFAHGTKSNSLLIRPFYSENQDWFTLNLESNRTSEIEIPNQININLTAPLEWSEEKNLVLLRTLENSGFKFTYFNLQTNQIFKVNEELWKILGLDWYYDEE